MRGASIMPIPKENETMFPDETGPTKRNGSYQFLFPFRIPYISEEK